MDKERHNWMVNTKVLYNFISCIRLPHQPLSVDFLPSLSWNRESNEDISFQYLACGLQAEEGEDVSLYLLEVAVPTEPLKDDLRCFSKCIDYDGFPIPGHSEPMYQCVSKAEHLGDINRIRSHAYEGSSFLAVKSTDVTVFDIQKGPKEGQDLAPVLALSGHEKEGYGLGFHSTVPIIGSCSDDGRFMAWDLTTGGLIYEFQHKEGLNCMEFLEDRFSAVAASEDGTALILDSRLAEVANRTVQIEGAMNAVSRHCENEDIFATGSTMGVVHLWDLRNLKEPLHDMRAHYDPIVRLQFNRNVASLIATASEDSTVSIMDLEDDGESDDEAMGEQDVEKTAHEMVFVHKGHSERVYDFCWSREERSETFITSVGEDYCLQLWQLTDSALVYSDDENNDNVET